MTIRKHDIVEVAGKIHGETAKAWNLWDGTKSAWLPKSQCEWDVDTKTMSMPEWLAMEKGLI